MYVHPTQLWPSEGQLTESQPCKSKYFNSLSSYRKRDGHFHGTKNPTLPAEMVGSPSGDTMDRCPAHITKDQMPGSKQLKLDGMSPVPRVGFDWVKTLMHGHY